MMVYMGNTGHIQKIKKKSKFYFDPRSPKIGFPEISGKKTEKKLRIRRISRPAWSRIRHRAKRKVGRVAGKPLRSATVVF